MIFEYGSWPNLLRGTKNLFIRVIAILQERKFHDAKKFLQHSLKKELSKSGIPKGLHSDLKKGFKILPAATSKSIKEAVSGLVNTDEKIFSSSK